MPNSDPGAPATTRIVGKDSWLFGNDSVRIALTQDGGHMAPVTSLCNDTSPNRSMSRPWGEDDHVVPSMSRCVDSFAATFLFAVQQPESTATTATCSTASRVLPAGSSMDIARRTR